MIYPFQTRHPFKSLLTAEKLLLNVVSSSFQVFIDFFFPDREGRRENDQSVSGP